MTSAHDHEPPADGPITLINIFEVRAGQVEEFIAQWRGRAESMAAAPGFRDAKLHRAVSSQARFQLVNVAHWDSQADLEAALRATHSRTASARCAKTLGCGSPPTQPCTRSQPCWASHDAGASDRHCEGEMS
jgi:heme oxygenase (mycobilin-producing)